MSKHTPGPWEMKPMREKGMYCTSALIYRPANKPDFSDSVYIGNLNGEYGLEITNANAHLIAAAPDLLEALQDMYEWHEIQEDPEWHGSPLEQRSSKAIAKAKGETG